MSLLSGARSDLGRLLVLLSNLCQRKKKKMFSVNYSKAKIFIFGSYLVWFVVDSPVNQVSSSPLLPRMLPSGAEYMRFASENISESGWLPENTFLLPYTPSSPSLHLLPSGVEINSERL